MNKAQTIIVTGGSGFIGSCFIRYIIKNTHHHIINIDALTYAGSPLNLQDIEKSDRYIFEHHSICDRPEISRIIQKYKPDKIIHLAAESHVDRSISEAYQFLKTNIIGTYTLLEEALLYWNTLNDQQKQIFKFHHVSTDEVYGDLEKDDAPFTETTPYKPSSPYSASKASSDHLVRAWHRTYNLPVVISNCSNNYGPFQFPEKLIPVVIKNALTGQPIPVYGQGLQIRDWLHVEDHVDALFHILMQGKIGETYNIGTNNEKRNIEVVRMICESLNELAPASRDYAELITFVSDRPGHDLRYAIDASKLEHDLNWSSKIPFSSGLHETIKWYLAHQNWMKDVVKPKEKQG